MSFFLSFGPTFNASTWTAAKNEVFNGLRFKSMGFLVVFLLVQRLARL